MREALAQPRAISRDEQFAMGAFEAPVPLGLARDQLGRERLLAMRTDDFLSACLGGNFGH